MVNRTLSNWEAGMAHKQSDMEYVDGTSKLRIKQVFKEDQLLVKLCRNNKEWLSPTGWVKSEKSTLLECKSDKTSSLVEIPAEFAKSLKPGDSLSLISVDGGFTADALWGKPAPKVKPAKKANGSSPVSETAQKLSLEETEKRAKDAEAAAANYKAKMNEAAKAREAAQATALEAARKADEALKAEAERIAEMESAAKAFEEAERQRLAEKRRLDKELKLEEERRLEAERIAEEARLKAEAERVRKERVDARKNIQAEIDKISAEKFQLDTTLSTAKSRLAKAEEDLGTSEMRRTRLEKSLNDAKNMASETQKTLKAETAKLDDLKAERSKITDNISEIDRDQEKLSKRHEKAQTAYQKAQKEAEAAKARAEDMLKTFEQVQKEQKAAQDRKASLAQETHEVEDKISVRATNLGNYKTASEKAAILSKTEQSEFDGAVKNTEQLKTKITEAKTDIARTLEQVKATQENLAKRKDSLQRIEDIENADEIRLIAQGTDSSDRSTQPSKKTAQDAASENTGIISRIFRRGKSEKTKTTETRLTQTGDSQTVETLTVKKSEKFDNEIPTIRKELTIANPMGSNKSRGRLNSWLMVGAALGAVTLIGSTYAVANKGDKPKRITEKPAPVTPQLASLTTPKTLTSEIAPATLTDVSADLTADIPSIDGSVDALVTDVENSAESLETTPTKKKVTLDEAVLEKAVLDETVENKAPVKVADIAIKPAKITPQEAKPVTAAAATTRATSVKPDTEKDLPNYPAVTRQVQENLQSLGYYQGALDGLQTTDTQKAIAEYKSFSDLPAGSEITPGLLNSLKRAIDDREASAIILDAVSQQVIIADAAPIKVADNSGEIIFYEPEAEISQAVIIPAETTDIVEVASIADTIDFAPAPIVPEAVPGTIIKAKLTKSAKIEYPERALRAREDINAKVYVAYDITENGKVTNASVTSVELSGGEKYRSAFEKAAIRAVQQQRFKPQTVNGVATLEKGRTTRINFNRQ